MRLTTLSHAIAIGITSLVLTACGSDDNNNTVKDIIAPTLTLNDDFTNDASALVSALQVVGNAKDASGIKSVNYQVNTGKSTPISIDSNGEFSQTIFLEPGENTVTISATDNAGNLVTTSKDIYLGNRLSAAGSHTGAIRDGKLYAWGRNNAAQVGLGYVSKLADGDTHPDVPFLLTSAPAEVVAISFNQNHSLALSKNGNVYSWGDDRFDQLGRGDTGRTDCISTEDCRLDIGQIPTINDAVMISAGYKHNLVLGKDGRVWAFGNNRNGQLGNGSTVSSNIPVEVDFSGLPNAGHIIQVVASADSSLALDDKGQVWGWGSNLYGTLGQGNLCDTTSGCVDETSTPVLINVLPTNEGASTAVNGNTDAANQTNINNPAQPERVTELAAGRDHVLALTNHENVYGWGLNQSSQVGYNGIGYVDTEAAWADKIATPTKLSWFTDKPVRHIFANGNTSYALLEDGTLYPWGTYGETNSSGRTVYENLSTPTDKLPMLKDIEAVAVGALHQIARDKSQTLYAWGWSFEGSLGGGEPTTNIWMYNIPFPINLPTAPTNAS